MEANKAVIRRVLFDNLGWKLLSVVIAVSLWFLFVGEPELVTSHYAPVLYKNLPGDLEIADPLPDQVRLELRGAAALLTPSALSETAVMMDLSEVRKPGERTYTLSAADLHLPRGVTFVRAAPSQLRLRVDRTMTKEVPVQVRLQSPLPPGYQVARQEVQPSKMRISGPEGRVRGIEFAQTDAIELSKFSGQTEFHVHAYLNDPEVRLASPEEVTIRIYLEKVPAGSNK